MGPDVAEGSEVLHAANLSSAGSNATEAIEAAMP
jgi:hypothetical protein